MATKTRRRTTRKDPKRVAAGKKAARTRARNSGGTTRRKKRSPAKKKGGLGEAFSKAEMSRTAMIAGKAIVGFGAGTLAGRLSGDSGTARDQNLRSAGIKLLSALILTGWAKEPAIAAGVAASAAPNIGALLNIPMLAEMSEAAPQYADPASLQALPEVLSDEYELAADYDLADEYELAEYLEEYPEGSGLYQVPGTIIY